MRRRRGRSEPAPPLSEINITPFTDVLLVLLIIFLLAGSAVPLVSGASLDTEGSQAAEAVELSPPEPVPLVVDSEGELRDLQGRLYSQERLEALSRETAVRLTGAPERPAELLIAAHDRLLGLGFRKLEFAAPREEGP